MANLSITGLRRQLHGQRIPFTDQDRRRLATGIRVVQTPWRTPNANAHAERFVRSIKQECLDRIVPLGEAHFRQTVSEYVVHYHRERNHQGLANALIELRCPMDRKVPSGGVHDSVVS